MHVPAIRYLAAIDGLRAVAVLSVVVYHLNARFLPGGFIGVDLFFVISGFVVSGALPSSGLRGIGSLLGFFYARRLTRILPALYVCLLVTTVLSLLFVPPSWLSGINEKTGRAAVLGYSNFILAQAAGNYFALRAGYNLFTHTWSLGVEEQFYAVFPWLFLPWLSHKRALSTGLFLSAATVSLVLAYRGTQTDHMAAFYSIFSRFWELAWGVLAFQVSSRIVVPGCERLRVLAAHACLAVIALSLITAAPNQTPFPASLAPCSAIALLLMLIRQGEARGILRGLAWRPAVLTGRVSYSLYLWHWPVLALFRWTAGLGTWASNSAALVLMAAAAIASYRYVETPPRRALSTGRVPAWGVLAAAAILIAVVYPVEESAWSFGRRLSLSSVTRHPADWYPDVDMGIVSASGCKLARDVLREMDFRAVRFERSHCAAPAIPAPNLFIVGDSHAGAYFVLLADYVLATGATGTVYYEGGCAVLGQKPNDEPLCDRFISTSLANAESRMRRGDVIFLPGLRTPRMVEEDTIFGEQAARDTMFGPAQVHWRKTNLAATIPVLEKLVAKGAQLVLEAPKPEFAAPPFRCHDWFNTMNEICAAGFSIARARIEELRAPVMAEFRAASAAIPGLRVWDPLPLLCPSQACSAYDGTKPLFFDGDHLSGYANRRLGPAFRAFILQGQG